MPSDDVPPQADDSRANTVGRLWRAPIWLLLGACRVVAPPVLLIALVELVLFALGLGEQPAHQDLSRGFDASVAYLVPDAETGGHRTQMFADPRREVVLPPKSDTPRVLLMGGSNTQQLWAPLIEAAFREVGTELEVFNLGREGYGSSRVEILLEQALVSQPDVVVLYTGHNEFLEPLDQAELAQYEVVTRSFFARVARSLRSYRLLVDALRPAPRLWSEPADDAGLPEPLTGLNAALSPAEVHVRHATYRANLERMIALCDAAGARVVLCTLVGNMLTPPYTRSPEDSVDEATRLRANNLRNEALALVPKRFNAVLHPPLRVRVSQWYGGIGVSPDLPAPELRPLYDALAETGSTRGGRVESVEGAHWPDPAGWTKPVERLVRGIERLMKRVLQPGDPEALTRALQLVDEALTLDPLASRLHFDRGVVLWLLRRDAEAVECFDRARDADSHPGSASRIVNGIVREVAMAHPQVALLDADALFRARVPAGLVGYEVMMDRCHLQPGARWVLEQDMATLISVALNLPAPASR